MDSRCGREVMLEKLAIIVETRLFGYEDWQSKRKRREKNQNRIYRSGRDGLLQGRRPRRRRSLGCLPAAPVAQPMIVERSQSVQMPFQWPEHYAAAIQPPVEPPPRALWFLFRRSALLVSAPPHAPALPHCHSPKDLGMMLRQTQYLGVLGGEHCFAADVSGEAPAPQGWSWQGLRSLFGALADAQVALAGRALQILDWDRTHQYCGACATPTVAKTEERSRQCPGCGLTVYPRLAPVVMCLVR